MAKINPHEIKLKLIAIDLLFEYLNYRLAIYEEYNQVIKELQRFAKENGFDIIAPLKNSKEVIGDSYIAHIEGRLGIAIEFPYSPILYGKAALIEPVIHTPEFTAQILAIYSELPEAIIPSSVYTDIPICIICGKKIKIDEEDMGKRFTSGSCCEVFYLKHPWKKVITES